MLKRIIGQAAGGSTGISCKLQQVTFNSIRKALPDSVIERACEDAGHVYRKRMLTPVVTVLHMILAALWPEESFQAAAQLIWDNLIAAFPFLTVKQPSSGSLAKARARLPLKLWRSVFRYLARSAEQLSEPFAYWRGHRVVLADGTCLPMPETPVLHKYFGSVTGRGGKRRYPLARMTAVSLANTMSVLDYGLGPYRQSEQTLLRPLLKSLRKGDLLVADRHFAGANLYAEYLNSGLHFLTRVHQRLNISGLHRLCGTAWDFVTEMPVGKTYKRDNPSLPAAVRVRLIRVKVPTRGRREAMWFATSLLESKTYPAGEIAKLYGSCWRIETLLGQLKTRLSADVLRSKTPRGVQKELASCVSALNAVRAIMLEAAAAHDQDPMSLSFTGALRAILTVAGALASSPAWKLPLIYNAMLREIASRKVRYRPGRQEPRAVTRERKHYPKLKTTRAQWKTQWAA